jgi:hypothetical protein
MSSSFASVLDETSVVIRIASIELPLALDSLHVVLRLVSKVSPFSSPLSPSLPLSLTPSSVAQQQSRRALGTPIACH